MAGGAINPGNPFGTPPPKRPPNIFDAYGASIPQAGSDYDSIMGNYDTLFKNATTNQFAPITAAPVQAKTATFTPQGTPSFFSPSQLKYNESGDTTTALSDLSTLASTGGYSDADIANIRERGVSPIRSVYADAQSNLDRQKSLQGGYSPGYTAATAKMARELSDKIAGQVTNINAGIAQSVAQNKLTAAPAYASAASAEADRALGAGEFNTGAQNQAGELNAQLAAQVASYNAQGKNATDLANAGILNSTAEANANRDLTTQEANRTGTQMGFTNALDATNAMRSLYGTTPALAATFGSQVLGQQDLSEGQRQFNTNTNRSGLGLVANAIRAGGGGFA